METLTVWCLGRPPIVVPSPTWEIKVLLNKNKQKTKSCGSTRHRKEFVFFNSGLYAHKGGFIPKNRHGCKCIFKVLCFLLQVETNHCCLQLTRSPCNEQSAKNASGNRNGWEIEEKVQKSCWSYASVCRSNFTKSIWLNCSVCRWCFIFIYHPNSCRMHYMNTIQLGALFCNCYYSLFVFKLLYFHILNMDVLIELLSLSVNQIGLPQNFHSVCNATANLIIKVTGIWIIPSWKHNGCSSSHRSIPKISPINPHFLIKEKEKTEILQ